MSGDLRLVIFDVDGTLVDSQADILSAMKSAFDAVGRAVPSRADVLGIVGLSLDVAMTRLASDASEITRAQMVQGYKDAYMEMRAKVGAAQSSPLYPGALETLKDLRATPDVVLGVATGKSKRGLDKLIEAHDLEGYFVTRQVADFHPSKPHPSMIHQAMRDAGVETAQTVMIGDTSFDMEMAVAAGVAGIGVCWGYHPAAHLRAAHVLVDDFQALHGAIQQIWETTV